MQNGVNENAATTTGESDRWNTIQENVIGGIPGRPIDRRKSRTTLDTRPLPYQICQHYNDQDSRYGCNIEPSLSDVLKFVEDIVVDDGLEDSGADANALEESIHTAYEHKSESKSYASASGDSGHRSRKHARFYNIHSQTGRQQARQIRSSSSMFGVPRESGRMGWNNGAKTCMIPRYSRDSGQSRNSENSILQNSKDSNRSRQSLTLQHSKDSNRSRQSLTLPNSKDSNRRRQSSTQPDSKDSNRSRQSSHSKVESRKAARQVRKAAIPKFDSAYRRLSMIQSVHQISPSRSQYSGVHNGIIEKDASGDNSIVDRTPRSTIVLDKETDEYDLTGVVAPNLIRSLSDVISISRGSQSPSRINQSPSRIQQSPLHIQQNPLRIDQSLSRMQSLKEERFKQDEGIELTDVMVSRIPFSNSPREESPRCKSRRIEASPTSPVEGNEISTKSSSIKDRSVSVIKRESLSVEREGRLIQREDANGGPMMYSSARRMADANGEEMYSSAPPKNGKKTHSYHDEKQVDQQTGDQQQATRSESMPGKEIDGISSTKVKQIDGEQIDLHIEDTKEATRSFEGKEGAHSMDDGGDEHANEENVYLDERQDLFDHRMTIKFDNRMTMAPHVDDEELGEMRHNRMTVAPPVEDDHPPGDDDRKKKAEKPDETKKAIPTKIDSRESLDSRATTSDDDGVDPNVGELNAELLNLNKKPRPSDPGPGEKSNFDGLNALSPIAPIDPTTLGASKMQQPIQSLPLAQVRKAGISKSKEGTKKTVVSVSEKDNDVRRYDPKGHAGKKLQKQSTFTRTMSTLFKNTVVVKKFPLPQKAKHYDDRTVEGLGGERGYTLTEHIRSSYQHGEDGKIQIEEKEPIDVQTYSERLWKWWCVLAMGPSGYYYARDVDLQRLALRNTNCEWQELSSLEQSILLRNFLVASLEFHFDPNARFMIVWGMIMMVALIYTGIYTPYEVGFVQPGERCDASELRFIVNRIVDSIFVIDIVFNFFLGVEQLTPLGVKLNRRRRDIVKSYVRGWFILDVLVSIPWDLIDCFIYHRKVIELFRLGRILRLARLSKVEKVFQRIKDRFDINFAQQTLLRFTIGTLIVCHWAACSWGMIGILHGGPSKCYIDRDGGYHMLKEDIHMIKNPNRDYVKDWIGISWIKKRYLMDYPLIWDLDPCDLSIIYQWSLHWSIMTTTSIGFGDVVPTTALELQVCITVMTITSTVWAYVVGKACAVVMQLNPTKQEFEQHMDALSISMKEQHITGRLKSKLRDYMREVKSLHQLQKSRDLARKLSPKLRMDYLIHRSQKWIGNLPMLEGCNKAFIISLIETLDCRMFAKREEISQNIIKLSIIENGSVGRAGKILLSGDVWGTDMILHNKNLQIKAYTVALNFVQIFTIGVQQLEGIYATFTNDKKKVKKFAARLALRRVMALIGRGELDPFDLRKLKHVAFFDFTNKKKNVYRPNSFRDPFFAKRVLLELDANTDPHWHILDKQASSMQDGKSDRNSVAPILTKADTNLTLIARQHSSNLSGQQGSDPSTLSRPNMGKNRNEKE